MIQFCICLLLPFTSVLSYPSSNNNQNSDRFELSNDFWSHHFGPDFKDAIHFHLQQSDVINTGDVLHKHFPEQRNNENTKRSTYVLHTPQLVKHQNRTLDNFMKVQLLAPGELEALERGVKSKEIFKNPLVVTLPEYGNIKPKNFNHATPPIIMNNPGVVYRNNQNSVHPQFFQTDPDIWREQNQQSTGYNPKMLYQQLPRSSYEKTMPPSYEQIVLKPIQPSYGNNFMQSALKQMSQPAQEKKMETLMQPAFEKPIESPPMQPPYDQQVQEKINDASSYEKAIQSSINTMEPSTDKMQPSTDTMQSSIDKAQPSTDGMEPSTDLLKSSYKTIPPSYKKVQATFEKIPTSYPKIRHSGYEESNPSYDHQPMDKFKKQSSYEDVQHPSYQNSRMMSYDKTTSSDLGRQSLKTAAENLEQTYEPKQGLPFDSLRDAKHGYRGEKETNT